MAAVATFAIFAGLSQLSLAAMPEEKAILSALAAEDVCESEGDEQCRLALLQLRGSKTESDQEAAQVAGEGCEDYCKYEGSKVWQYDPKCQTCTTAMLEEAETEQTEEQVPSEGCADYCKYEGSKVWQYDPKCQKCTTAMLEEQAGVAACPDDVLLGHWVAQAKLSFLKDPLEVGLEVTRADDNCATPLKALLEVPGQQFHYDVAPPKETENGVLSFKFQNNKDKEPYWHPGTYDPETKKITEHLDTVGNVATQKVQSGTGGVLGMKQFVFQKK